MIISYTKLHTHLQYCTKSRDIHASAIDTEMSQLCNSPIHARHDDVPKLGVIKKFGGFPRNARATKHDDVMDTESYDKNQPWNFPITPEKT
jgi:hypothetical protein